LKEITGKYEVKTVVKQHRRGTTIEIEVKIYATNQPPNTSK
jgi:hypothetical protein